MTITADNFFSWQVAAWLATASLVVTLAWLATRRIQTTWLRVFLRAGIVTLCFAPLPHLLMFMEEGAKARVMIITPLWYALFRSIADGALLGAGVVVILWLVVTYFLWVAGMSIHRLVRRLRSTNRCRQRGMAGPVPLSRRTSSTPRA